MKNKFLQVSIGVTIMLLAAGFFIRSFNVLNAAPTPEKFLQQGTNKLGKYMITACSTSSERMYCWVWDTETGKSVLYDYTSNKGWVKDDYQLPETSR